MNRQEYERLKEEEKAHLRELRRLRERLRQAERTRNITQAVNEVESGADSDEFDEALRNVQEETLEGEVRLDMALEAVDPVTEEAVDPEEERRLRAAALVRQMKVAMGGIEPEEAVRDVGDEPGEEAGKRTIGKPASEDESAEEDEPDKTIGRMVRHSDETD